MLELINVNAYYGRIQALKDVSLRVDEGKIVSLLGANGSGKTTTVRTIVGLNRSIANDIRFEGRPIGRIPPHQIVRLGIAMVPERRELFSDMKVIDNLEMGAYSRANMAQMRRDLDRIYELVPGPGGTGEEPRRSPERGPATDAGNRSRVDVASAPALARRAHSRIGAFDRKTNFRDAATAEPKRKDNSPYRAERESGAQALRLFLYFGKWPNRSRREEQCSDR